MFKAITAALVACAALLFVAVMSVPAQAKTDADVLLSDNVKITANVDGLDLLNLAVVLNMLFNLDVKS
jgi:hypothetical protein